jgi:hypothetical protein
MKLLPEGFQALLAPAAMLPAELPRPDTLPMVSAMFVLGVPAGKDGIDIFIPANAGVPMVASASAAIMDSFFMARSPSCFSWRQSGLHQVIGPTDSFA